MIKNELRKTYLSKRRALNSEQIADGSSRIVNSFERFCGFENQIIHCFISIQKNSEIDTSIFIAKALSSATCKMAVPVVIPDTNEFKSIEINKTTEYHTSAMGICEPVTGTILAPTEFTVVVVPLLVCDQNGQRIGYGGGYYDRFLAKTSTICKKVGISFFEPIENNWKTSPHDQPIDLLITPKQVTYFR